MEDGSSPEMVFDITTVHTERVIEVTETLAEITDGVVDDSLEVTIVDNDYPTKNINDEIVLSDIFNGMDAVYTTAA
jgi:hypothetical protein